VFALLCAFFLHPASGMSLTLLLATDDTPGNPWIMGGGLHFQKDLPGIEIELYRHMAGQLGLELKMVRMPWKRCLFELKAGLLDGVFPASFKPERLEIGVFPFKNGKVDQTRKSRDSAYYLYRLKSSPVTWRDGKFVNLEQMPRPTIGAPLGWSIVEDLRRMNIDVLERPRPIELLEMLSKGGLAGVACLSTVADVYIVQAPTSSVRLKKCIHPFPRKPIF